MFGDFFGQRGDYSKGTFYAAHRMYLSGSNGKSQIHPPKEFLSKRQLRHMRLLKDKSRDTASDEKKGFIMNFQKKHEDDGNQKKFKKVANLVKKAHIASDHAVVVHKEDWIEKREAGVKIWVNRHTGDVLDECPWKDVNEQIVRMAYKSPVVLPMNRKAVAPETDEMAGTGALVYDGKEVDELFQMLDAVTTTKKK